MKNVKNYVIALPLFFCLLAFTGFKPKGGNPSASGGGTAMELGSKSTFTFNAVEHKDGSVNGHLVYHFRASDITIHMDIECLNIVGNRATLSGTVTSVNGNTTGFPFIVEGAKAAFSVEDNGEGNAANPDKVSDLLFGVPTCAGMIPPYIVISGNVQVKP